MAVSLTEKAIFLPSFGKLRIHPEWPYYVTGRWIGVKLGTGDATGGALDITLTLPDVGYPYWFNIMSLSATSTGNQASNGKLDLFSDEQVGATALSYAWLVLWSSTVTGDYTPQYQSSFWHMPLALGKRGTVSPVGSLKINFSNNVNLASYRFNASGIVLADEKDIPTLLRG